MARHLNYDDIKPGQAAREAKFAPQRNGILIRLAAWSTLAVVAVGLSWYSYHVASQAAGSGSFTWTLFGGPIVLGVVNAVRAFVELIELDNQIRRGA